MRELVIDRSVWLRGEGTKLSRLLRPSDGKMCCVGIYLQACKVPLKKLCNTKAAAQINVPEEAAWLVADTCAAGDLYEANDAKGGRSRSRESSIRKIFAKFGVAVRFVDSAK